MKKTVFFLLALFLGSAGVQATTVRKYLRLSDANFAKIWNSENISSDPKTGEVTFTGGANNFSIGWQWSSGIDVSSYTTMTLKLKEAASVDLLVRFRDDSEGYWGVWDVTDGVTLTAGQTELNITLSDIKHKSDNSDFNFNTLKLVEIHDDANGTTTTIKIDDLYFEKEVTADYATEPFDVSGLGLVARGDDNAAATWNADDWTIKFPAFNQNIGWTYATPQDWSAYKYLVMVPQQKFVNDDNITTHLYVTVGSTEVDAMDYQAYNTEASAKDLTTIEGGVTNVNNAYFRFIYDWVSETKTFPLSAVYLTNTPLNKAYTRTSAAAGTWGTLCLPYAAAIMNATVYDVVGVDSKDSPSTLYLQRVHGVLTPGKAYVVKSTSTENITVYQVSENELKTPVDGNLQGTFTGADVPTGSYILVNGTWKKVGTTYPKTVGANKAYLTLDNSLVVPQEQAARYIAFDIEGSETTGINTVNGEGLKVDGYYNLAGQRISQPVKGQIYIKNGRKYIAQ